MPRTTTLVATTLLAAMMEVEMVAKAWRIAATAIERLSLNTLSEYAHRKTSLLSFVTALAWSFPLPHPPRPTRFIFALPLSL